MLREKFALTDQGAADFKKGVFFCSLANIALMAPISILYLVTQGFVSHLIDPLAPLPDMVFYVIAIILILAIMFITQWWEYNATYNIVYDESARKRIGLAEKLRQLPLSFFGRRDLSDLTTSIMKDCADQERMFSHVMPQLFGLGVSTVLISVGLFFFDWRLALAALWPIPVAILLLVASMGLQQRKGHQMNVRQLALADGIQEYLECAQEVRATNQTTLYLKGLGERVDAYEKAKIGNELIAGTFVSSSQAVLRLGIATTVLVGASLLITGQIEFMVCFCFLLVVTRIYDPINVVLQSIAELINLRLSLKRLQAIENEPAQTGTVDYHPDGHDLVFDEVSFSYSDGKQVLDRVSFTAKEGEVTALVGPSGSGKSTIAKLAARFWDVQGGAVLVGGVDVSSIDPETLLQDFSEVFQDVVLFDDTVLENIRLGRTDASDEEVIEAAKAANCLEFVERIPDGFSTLIGENGSRLSGGERQRISIARALLKAAPIVLLDEATASLDVENETQVQQALSRLLAGKTVLVIAHRMRTVANADKIVVLNEGRVVECGRPSDLARDEQGLYRRMIDLQNESAQWSIKEAS